MVQDPHGKTPPSTEDLAAEYLARKAAGEAVTTEEFHARLGGEAARAEFDQLVAGAGAVERGLPRALGDGSKIAGRYRITGVLGGGGMGKVFSAFDEKLHREVAVKVLAPLAQGNQQREEMFARESRILAELRHPGIVSVHDAGNDGEFTFIVMERIDGTALVDVIERARSQLQRRGIDSHPSARDGEILARAIGADPSAGRRSLLDPDWFKSSARLVLEIAHTLEAAHEKQVVHRDLKPANVMLLGGGAPVLLDFGLAGNHEVKGGAVTDSLLGSLPYLAPEQVRSERVGKDLRTDIYQLGLMLYELLTLRRAFGGSAVTDVLQRIQQGYFQMPRKLNPAVPRDLEAICMKALELSPERRYATAKEFREDLERWLDGRTPHASRSARWRSFARTTRYTGRRHPVLAAAIGMLLVGGGIYAWQQYVSPHDVPVTISFFRLDPKGGKLVALRSDDEVFSGDYLGFDLVQSREAYVYALSVFGEEGQEKFVAPWYATDRDHLEDLNASNPRPWGWHVKESDAQVICTRITPDREGKMNGREGLLVLVSDEARPELEDWKFRLESRQGQTGVPYDEALGILQDNQPVRGVPPNSWNPSEMETVRAALKQAREKKSLQLGLPGVEDYSIECRVGP